MELYKKLHSAMMEGLIASCHDCSDGGLGIALAESAFAGGFGMEVDLSKVPAEGIERDDYLLFSESQSITARSMMFSSSLTLPGQS